jgi:hypothetical protein
MTTTVVTPTLRRSAHRSLFWILGSAFVIVVAVVGLALTGGANSGGVALSPTNAAPQGSKAIAEVLRQQGVEVATPATFRAAMTALAGPGTTLFLYDPNGFLDETQLKRLTDSPRQVVLLAPTFAQLKTLAPDVGNAGVSTKAALAGDCSLPAVQNAGSVTGGGTTGGAQAFRLVAENSDATTCLASGKKSYALIELRSGIRTTTVLGTTAALANEHLSERGNAALALTLLGENARLVWYLPTAADAAGGGKSIAELTPLWVTPVLVLLVITVIAAAVWRGRRLGPLVVENLPVTVRASETMEGRARLYQRGGARLHALDALRIGAASRLAAHCGLPRLATIEEIVLAVSSLTGTPAGTIRALLVEDVPTSDADLVRLSDALLETERAVAAAIRPA